MHSWSIEEIEGWLQGAEGALSEEDDDLTKALKRHDVMYHLNSLESRQGLQKTILESRRFLGVARKRAREFVAAVEAKDVMAGQRTDRPPCIFIDHGGSQVWNQLATFIRERLGLEYEEFNRQSIAGRTTVARLQEMLDHADFAFLVLTGEDEKKDGTFHARENVIHEAGLFQGKLGFNRTIILLEEGCEEFSNIHGLGQIRFRKGDLRSEFEEIRRVLEREGLLRSR